MRDIRTGLFAIGFLLLFSPAALAEIPRAEPSNANTAFRTISLSLDRTASAGTSDHINLTAYPDSLHDETFFVSRDVGGVSQPVALLNGQIHDATIFEVNGTSPSSFVEFAVSPPRYATSLGVSLNAHTIFAGSGVFNDLGDSLVVVRVTYEDNSVWAQDLRVGEHVRGWFESGITCGSATIPPATAFPTDPLAIQLFAGNSHYLDFLELRLPRVAQRITQLRIESVRRDHFCSTFQPHIYGGFILNGATLWPEFDLRSRSGTGIVPQYQSDQPYSGEKYGGYLDPVSGEIVGSHRTIGSKGCFLATLAMALTFVGVPITVPELQADMQANRGFIPEQVCRIVSVGGQSPADTVVITGLPHAAGHEVPAWSEFVVNRTQDPFSGALARFLVLDSTRAIVLAHADTAPPIAATQPGFAYRLVSPDEVAKRLTGASGLRLGFELHTSDSNLPMAVESAMMDSLPSLLYVGPNDTIPHWVLTTAWVPGFVSRDSARGTYGIIDPAQSAGPTTLRAVHGNRYKGAWIARVAGSGDLHADRVPVVGSAGAAATLQVTHTGHGHMQLVGPGGALVSYHPETDSYNTNIPGAVVVRHAHPGDPSNPNDPDVPADLLLLPVSGPASYSVTSLGTASGTVALTATYQPDVGPSRAAGESAALEQGGRGIFTLAVDPASPEPVEISLVTTVDAQPVMPQRTLGLRISPNPAAGPVRIDFTLPKDGPLRLTVFDVAGRRVRTLLSGNEVRGAYHEPWDGRDDVGAPLRAGLYFVRLQVGGGAATTRCLRLAAEER